MFQSGSATDYFDLLDQLIQVATSDHCSAAAVNAGGSGYAVDDILTIDNTGATRTHDVTLRVTSESGGAITGLRVETGGAYTVDPSTLTGNALGGGSGTGATADLTFTATGWTVQRRSREAVSATVASGGSGYTVGDDLTLVTEDAVGETIAAVFNVDSVSSGAVTAVSLVTAGLYEEQHGSPTDIATTGGTGTGAELDVTFGDANDQDERVVILEGSAGGLPLVGIRAYSDLDVSGFDTVFNWSLSGFTGFSGTLEFANQAGISPGDDRVLSTGGAYVTLRDQDGSFPIDFGFTVDDRRITGWALVENATITHYSSWYLGFLNQFGTATEFPYPIYISGNTSRFNSRYSDTTIARNSGIVELIGRSGSPGPGWIRRTDNQWQEVRNSNGNDGGSPSRSASALYTVYPVGRATNVPETDDVIVGSGAFDWLDVIPGTGIPGSPTLQLHPSEDSGGNLFRLIPATVVASDSGEDEFEIKGELDGVFWISTASGGISEDVIIVGTERYTIVQNGSRAEDWSYMAVRQS